MMAFSLNSKIVFANPSIISLKLNVPSILQTRTLVELPIEWKRPVKVPWYDPKKTGDGVLKNEVDMNKSPTLMAKSKEIETANENVKKLFSFHFLGRRYAMKRAQEEMVESVRNHEYDNRSLEVQIAANTSIIRNLMEHYHSNVLDKKTRIYLKELIEKRNRKLGDMRKFDYKKFEWLLEKLDLYYKPQPEVLDKVERKKSIRYLTQRYCEEFKERKLEEYKEILESQKLNFLKDKISTLEWIRKEELECGVKSTVTETDIQNAKDQLSGYIKTLETLEKKKEDNILQDI